MDYSEEEEIPRQERQPVRRCNEGRVHGGEHERVSQRGQLTRSDLKASARSDR